jgi:hypothetical protein
MRRRAERLVLAAAALAGALSAAGCHDAYIARRDGVTFQAGDAVAANKAMHIIDPWPASASSARIPGRGTQATTAIERLAAREAQAGGPGAAPGGPGASAQAAGVTAGGAR